MVLAVHSKIANHFEWLIHIGLAHKTGYTYSNSIEQIFDGMKMKDATHLGTLQTYWKRHQTFPPMAKLCEVLGLSSTSSVFALIGRLTDAGYVKRHEGRIVPDKLFFARPVLGPVRAGQPQPATQEESDLITLDDYLIDNLARTSVHKVRGDSMKDAGIFDGDLVVVEYNSPTSPGDIVVAVVDGEWASPDSPDGLFSPLSLDYSVLALLLAWLNLLAHPVCKNILHKRTYLR